MKYWNVFKNHPMISTLFIMFSIIGISGIVQLIVTRDLSYLILIVGMIIIDIAILFYLFGEDK
jgi:cytochrome c biogenesis protein CcdA